MNKLYSLYLTLIILVGILHSPLYGMHISRAADNYAMEQPTHRSCFTQLRIALKQRQHRHCSQPLCPRLIAALETGDLATFDAHLDQKNSNLLIMLPVSDFESFNLLAFLLGQHTPTSFKIACIQLLIDRGFSQPILEPILKKNDCNLLQAFLKLPIAQTSFICSSTLPLDIYNWWNIGFIIDKIALTLSKHYSTNTDIPADLRDKFSIINRIIQHGSIRNAIYRKDIKLIAETQQHLPVLLSKPLRYDRRAVSVTEYIHLSHQDGRLSERTFRASSLLNLPGSVDATSELEQEIDDQPHAP